MKVTMEDECTAWVIEPIGCITPFSVSRIMTKVVHHEPIGTVHSFLGLI